MYTHGVRCVYYHVITSESHTMSTHVNTYDYHIIIGVY